MPGSSSEYGYQTEPMSEASLPDPTRVHDIAKLAQSLYGTYAARFKGLPLVTLRLFSVYGPWEHGRRLLPRLMLSALQGRPVSLSSPHVGRDFIFVDDVVRAVEHCVQRPALRDGSIVNLGTGVEHTIRDAVNLLEEIHGGPLAVTWGAVERKRWELAALGRRHDAAGAGSRLHGGDRLSRGAAGDLSVVCRQCRSLSKNTRDMDDRRTRPGLSGDEEDALATCHDALQWLSRYRDTHDGVFPERIFNALIRLRPSCSSEVIVHRIVDGEVFFWLTVRAVDDADPFNGMWHYTGTVDRCGDYLIGGIKRVLDRELGGGTLQTCRRVASIYPVRSRRSDILSVLFLCTIDEEPSSSEQGRWFSSPRR